MAHSEVRVLGTHMKINTIPASKSVPQRKWTKRHTSIAVTWAAGFFLLCIIVFGLCGIWTGDERFGYTAGLFAVPTFIFGMISAFRWMEL